MAAAAAAAEEMAPWEQHAAVIAIPRFDYKAPSSLLEASHSGFLITCPISNHHPPPSSPSNSSSFCPFFVLIGVMVHESSFVCSPSGGCYVVWFLRWYDLCVEMCCNIDVWSVVQSFFFVMLNCCYNFVWFIWWCNLCEMDLFFSLLMLFLVWRCGSLVVD